MIKILKYIWSLIVKFLKCFSITMEDIGKSIKYFLIIEVLLFIIKMSYLWLTK